MEPIITNINDIKLVYEPVACSLFDDKVRSSKELYKLLMAFYDPDTIGISEEFITVYLNNANQVLGVYRGFKGGITHTAVDFRLILNIGIRCLCTQIVVSHNHPSGRLIASESDIQSTKKLKESCMLLDINLLDHLIVTPNSGYFSLAENGLL